MNTSNQSLENDTFLYFAFGSNLFASRLQVNSPSAKYIGIARLSQHKLGFSGFSVNWKGSVANIFSIDTRMKNSEYANELISDPEDAVWGAVWEISKATLSQLDAQEGVHMKEYEPINVNVDFLSKDADIHNCATIKTIREWLKQQQYTHNINDTNEVTDICNYIASYSSTWNIPKENFKTIQVRTYRKVAGSNACPDNIKLGLPSNSYKLVIVKGAIECGLPMPYIQQLATLRTNGNCSDFVAWKMPNPR